MKQKTMANKESFIYTGKHFLVRRFLKACEIGDVKKVKRMLKEGKIIKLRYP